MDAEEGDVHVKSGLPVSVCEFLLNNPKPVSLFESRESCQGRHVKDVMSRTSCQGRLEQVILPLGHPHIVEL